jgi:transposase
MEELTTMSTKELDRVAVMARLVDRSLTQRAAAEILQVTVRQVRRLQRAYDARGPVALASKRRGRPSNRRLPADVRDRVVQIVKERYSDFGPTLARMVRGPSTTLHALGLRRRCNESTDGVELGAFGIDVRLFATTESYLRTDVSVISVLSAAQDCGLVSICSR